MTECARRPRALARLWSRISLPLRLTLAFATTFPLFHVCMEYMEKTILWEPMHSYFVAVAAKDFAERIHWDESGRPRKNTDKKNLSWFSNAFPQDVLVTVTDMSGQVLMSIPTPLPTDIAPPGTPGGRPGRTTSFLVGPNGSETHRLSVAISDRLIEVFLRAWSPSSFTFLTAGLSLLVTALAAIAIPKYMLRPLRAISATAGQISPANLTQRIPANGLPPDLRPLVDAFNQTLDRLEDGFRTQREFLATTAHELKTPLALIRGQIEMEDSFPSRQIILRDIDLMARHVQQLLHLAELREPASYTLAPMDPWDVALDVAEYLDRQAESAGVAIDLLPPADRPTVTGDADAIFVLLRNLVENAITHSPPGGVVTIDGTATSLRVRDQGPGISPGHLPHLFERFWRGKEGGTGLGLAICQEIVRIHGWTIAGSNIPPDKQPPQSQETTPTRRGATFEVAFQSK